MSFVSNISIISTDQQIHDALSQYPSLTPNDNVSFKIVFKSSPEDIFQIVLSNDFPDSPPQILLNDMEFPTSIVEYWKPSITLVQIIRHLHTNAIARMSPSSSANASFMSSANISFRSTPTSPRSSRNNCPLPIPKKTTDLANQKHNDEHEVNPNKEDQNKNESNENEEDQIENNDNQNENDNKDNQIEEDQNENENIQIDDNQNEEHQNDNDQNQIENNDIQNENNHNQIDQNENENKDIQNEEDQNENDSIQDDNDDDDNVSEINLDEIDLDSEPNNESDEPPETNEDNESDEPPPKTKEINENNESNESQKENNEINKSDEAPTETNDSFSNSDDVSEIPPKQNSNSRINQSKQRVPPPKKPLNIQQIEEEEEDTIDKLAKMDIMARDILLQGNSNSDYYSDDGYDQNEEEDIQENLENEVLTPKVFKKRVTGMQKRLMKKGITIPQFIEQYKQMKKEMSSYIDLENIEEEEEDL